MKKSLLIVCGVVMICACGGGGGGGGYTPPATPPAIYVSISPAAQTNIDQGQTVQFSATVQNDSSSKGVTWSCSGSGLGAACGSFTDSTTNSATYNAPTSVSGNVGITVIATSIADATKTGSAMVMVSPPPSVTSSTLPGATANTSYSATLQASGGAGTLTWSVVGGGLPPGLSLAGSGAITGTPTASGTFTFTVQVLDLSASPTGPNSAQGQISITVTSGSGVSISTTQLPAGSQNAAYSAGLAASGGATPYTWSVTAGSLPPGLSLQASSGVISGTPTSPGNFTFTVMVKDSSPTPQTQTRSLTINIGSTAPPPAITTTSLTNATPNANYSATLQATGGTGTLTWSLASGALPTGLALSGSGAITGVPTVPGSFTFAVQVADSSPVPASAQAQLSITVVTVMSIATTQLPAGSEGIAYLAQIDASGGVPPYSSSRTVGSLPPGLALQTNSGVIFGSPTSMGSSTFTVAVTDSSPTPQTQSQTFSLAIGTPGPLVITTSSLLDGTSNKPYTAMAAALGGTPPYTWSIPTGRLPAGVSLNASTGAIAGTPSPTGTSYFTILVTDSSSTPETQTQNLSITVDNPAEACSSSGHNAALNGPYAFSLSGFNDAGFLTVVGSFTADGTGRITAGEADSNGVLGVQHGNVMASASSYSVGADGRGCATMATPFGTFATHFALGSMSSTPATSGRMIEWDSPSASAYIATGQLLRQNPSAFAGGLAGSYVFRTVGWDAAPLGGRDACVGVIGAAGNTFSAMEQDCNDAWNISNTSAPAVAGTYTSLDASGRGTGIIALGQSNSNLTFYAVSSTQLLMVNGDATPALSGRVTLTSNTQSCGGTPPVFYLTGLNAGFLVDSAPGVDTGSFEPQSGGPFNNASLTGNYFGGMAEVVIQSAQAEVDPVAPNGSGSISGMTDISSTWAQDAGASFLAATYTVNADGTFSVSSSGRAVAGVIISSSKFVMFSPTTLATPLPTLLVMQK